MPANRVEIPDVPLLNEHGRPVRFRELLSAPVVVVNFIFTTCPTICLPLGANFASLGRQLGSRRGKRRPTDFGFGGSSHRHARSAAELGRSVPSWTGLVIGHRVQAECRCVTQRFTGLYRRQGLAHADDPNRQARNRRLDPH